MTSAATTPTIHLLSAGRTADLVAARWQEWLGPVTVWRAPGQPITPIRDRHSRWLTSLLQRGIPMRAVRRHSLDDPRAPASTLESRTDEYLARRNARSQRTPGTPGPSSTGQHPPQPRKESSNANQP